MARFGFAFFDSGVHFDEPATIPITYMRNLHYYLENPFDDPGISIAELLAFSTDHLQRLIAQNTGGLYTGRVTATQSALDLVGDYFTDDMTKLGLRKARKQSKDAARTALPGQVTMIHAAVVAKFGANAPQVTECFPQGRAVFGSCTDDAVETHLQTMINGVTAYQAQLGAQVVTDATAIKTAWLVVYNASETSTAAKATTEEGKRNARENLQLMLFLNLLTLALAFPRQPAQLDVFMQQALLEDHPAAPPVPPPGP